MLPVTGLVDQRSGLGAASTEDDRGNRHALRICELRGDAGAVDRRCGETGVGMRTLGTIGAIPLVAHPVDRVLRRILVQTLPPDRVVVQIVNHVGENGVLSGGLKRVRIGLDVGTRCNTEETVLGVDRPEAPVRTDPQPCDVIADCPDLVSCFEELLGRNQHRQVGLAARGRERCTDIFDLALRILKAEDQHMLCHPALHLRLIGSNAQRKALFAEQDVAAVARVDRPDRVVLGEVDDIPVLLLEFRLGVQAADKIVGLIAQLIKSGLSHTGHDVHVQNDIGRVGQLNADFGERGTDRTHAVGDDIHGAALHTAVIQLFELFIHDLRVFPVVGRACILFVSGADIGSAFNTRDIVDRSAVQQASREFLLVELLHLPDRDRKVTQLLELLLAAVNPDHLVRFDKRFHFLNPVEDIFVVCHFRFSSRCIKIAT